MRTWVSRMVLMGLALAAGGGLVGLAWAQQAPRTGTGGTAAPGPRDQPPPMAPDQQAAYLLHQSYDALNQLSIWTSSKQAKLPDAESRLGNPIKDFYRDANRAYKDRNYTRATALALAALDGSRGLMIALHASTPPEGDLPAPPDIPTPSDQGDTSPAAGGSRSPASRAGGPPPMGRPQDGARELLRVARERILASEKADAGQDRAQPFLDAARQAYEDSRQAYKKGNYTKSLGLAAAAEAWTHIGEHLRRAGGSGRTGAGSREALPPPEDQDDQPLPPRRPSTNRQPPPPPER